MDLLNYNLNQLRRTYHKKYENYVISRIFHRLDKPDLQIVTQQLVRRPKGIALTDLYFPQLNLHIEVDEPHHIFQIEDDELRKLDIIDATNHQIERIKISDSNQDIYLLNEQIDDLIKRIEKLIETQGYNKWDPIKEFDYSIYLEKGYLDIIDNPRFRTITDAANCLGQNVKGMQRAFFRSKKYLNHNLWFPKLYPNGGWDNQLQNNGELILEKPNNQLHIKNHYDAIIKDNKPRIVFPRFMDNLGSVVYRFMGIFIIDKTLSSEKTGIVYRRVNTKMIL